MSGAEWEGKVAVGKRNDINKVTLSTDLPLDERDKGRNQIRGFCKNLGEG